MVGQLTLSHNKQIFAHYVQSSPGVLEMNVQSLWRGDQPVKGQSTFRLVALS